MEAIKLIFFTRGVEEEGIEVGFVSEEGGGGGEETGGFAEGGGGGGEEAETGGFPEEGGFGLFALFLFLLMDFDLFEIVEKKACKGRKL
jgi:hypothetical protein